MVENENITIPELSGKKKKNSVFEKLLRPFERMMAGLEKEEYHCLITLKTGTRILMRYPTKEEAIEYLDWYKSDTGQPFKLIESLPDHSTRFTKEDGKELITQTVSLDYTAQKVARISKDDIEAVQVKEYHKYEQLIISLKVYLLQAGHGIRFTTNCIISALIWSLFAAGFFFYTPIRDNELIVSTTRSAEIVIQGYLLIYLISILYEAHKNKNFNIEKYYLDVQWQYGTSVLSRIFEVLFLVVFVSYVVGSLFSGIPV